MVFKVSDNSKWITKDKDKLTCKFEKMIQLHVLQDKIKSVLHIWAQFTAALYKKLAKGPQYRLFADSILHNKYRQTMPGLSK